MVNNFTKTISVVGLGYVGLPLAISFAKAGFRVIGIDKSEKVVENLNLGISHIEDVANSELSSIINKQFFKLTTDFSQINESDSVILCVPTPLDRNRQPDLGYITLAIELIVPHLKSDTLIVNESTSFPGTLRNIIIPLVKKLRKGKVNDLLFAAAPERVNPGDVLWNQKNTPRLVAGIDLKSNAKVIELYSYICSKVVNVKTPEIAEAAKLLENCYRLVNIALVNEFARICSSADINIHEVVDAAATKPYGFSKFKPGPGVGGHCIPVDPIYFSWWAKKLGTSSKLVDLADEINLEMSTYISEEAIRYFKESCGEKNSIHFLLLGVAYKSGLSDTRETPAQLVRNYLIKSGHKVSWIDPLVKNWNDTTSNNDFSDIDIGLVLTFQNGFPMTELQVANIPVLDFTNSFSNFSNVRCF